MHKSRLTSLPVAS